MLRRWVGKTEEINMTSTIVLITLICGLFWLQPEISNAAWYYILYITYYTFNITERGPKSVTLKKKFSRITDYSMNRYHFDIWFDLFCEIRSNSGGFSLGFNSRSWQSLILSVLGPLIILVVTFIAITVVTRTCWLNKIMISVLITLIVAAHNRFRSLREISD